MAHLLRAQCLRRHTQAHSSAAAAYALKHKLFHSENCFEIVNCFFGPLGWKVLYQYIIINDNKLFLRRWGCFTSYGAKWVSSFPWVHPKCEIPADEPSIPAAWCFTTTRAFCSLKTLRKKMLRRGGAPYRCWHAHGRPGWCRLCSSLVAFTGSQLYQRPLWEAWWLKCFHRLFFWDPFQFLWIGLLFALLPRPVHRLAALPGPPRLARTAWPGVGWGQGMIQSQISVTNKAAVNSITDFRQHPCLLFFLERSSSLLQVQERRNEPLRCNHWLWKSLFFLTLPLTFKYSGFIVLKDALCKGILQKAEGLTVLNMCSGVLGALLTKWASQRCISNQEQ